MVDITKIVQAILTLIIVVITTFVIPCLKQKFNSQKVKNLEVWVKIAVQAAEQLYQGYGLGDKKKEFVLQFLGEKGLTLDYDGVDAMIESAVLDLKKELK